MSNPIHIWIDDQIADRESFASLGVVHPFSGRTVTRDDLTTADALIVRSVTRVDQSLLDGTTIKFVGSVTAGADHLDTTYLQSKQIQHALATGFNARPVAEYVMAAIFLLAERRGVPVESWTLGIVGVGRVGSMVRDVARSVGMSVLLNDPIREATNAEGPWSTLDSVLATSDVVTLHVPLTDAGDHVTRQMIGLQQLALMKPTAILINAARGGVVDETSLGNAIQNRAIGGAVIDTWENEPRIDSNLVALCDVATPHCAGHSVEARRRGAQMIRSALASWIVHGGSSKIVHGSIDGTPVNDIADAVAGGDICAGTGYTKPIVDSDDVSGIAINSCSDAIYGVNAGLATKEMADRLAHSCPLVEIDRRLKDAGGRIAARFDTIRTWAGQRNEIVV